MGKINDAAKHRLLLSFFFNALTRESLATPRSWSVAVLYHSIGYLSHIARSSQVLQFSCSIQYLRIASKALTSVKDIEHLASFFSFFYIYYNKLFYVNQRMTMPLSRLCVRVNAVRAVLHYVYWLCVSFSLSLSVCMCLLVVCASLSPCASLSLCVCVLLSLSLCVYASLRV